MKKKEMVMAIAKELRKSEFEFEKVEVTIY
jgi:hypothetical protein